MFFHKVEEIQSYLPKLIVNEYIDNQNDSDKRVGEHILELIKHRDSLDIWLLRGGGKPIYFEYTVSR